MCCWVNIINLLLWLNTKPHPFLDQSIIIYKNHYINYLYNMGHFSQFNHVFCILMICIWNSLIQYSLLYDPFHMMHVIGSKTSTKKKMSFSGFNCHATKVNQMTSISDSLTCFIVMVHSTFNVREILVIEMKNQSIKVF